jgi:hypothetical protein
LVLLFAWGCDDDDDGPTRCDPAAAGACGDGAICVVTGPDGAECRPVCDPATPTCGDGGVCVRQAGGTYACLRPCDPAATNPCGEAWICAPAGNRGNVCRPACTLGGAACPDGEVCQPLPDGSAACTTECSVETEDSCPSGLACELRTDGLHACYAEVVLAGRVFDLAADAAIADARVAAADAAGAAASDVAVTDAEGLYELVVPVDREPDGTFVPGRGTVTLRAAARDYEIFPHGIRQALPIDCAAGAVEDGDRWLVQSALTDVGLIPLPDDWLERGSVSGRVDARRPGGVLLVAQGTSGTPMGWSDWSGDFVLFNIRPGTYAIHGFKAGLQLRPEPISVEEGADLVDVVIHEITDVDTAVVSGSIQIVNPGDCAGTSVVLVPAAAFDETLARGEVAPGLRAPAPGTAPSVTGAFSIAGVPDGEYVVLAAFENDRCVRDPDPGIAGTQIARLSVPDTTEGRAITIDTSFKVTGALAVISPGAAVPEAVTGTPTFTWEDDSSEDAYHLVVYDAFCEEAWRREDLPGASGGTPSVAYGDGGTTATALESGMYYQFRVTSLRRGGENPISMTEDLLGVFYLE